MANGMPNLRDHADKMVKEMAEKGVIAPDASSASLAGAIPAWSKGTVALDENTGQPVVPDSAAQAPEFGSEKVAVPEGQPLAASGAAPAEKSAEDILAEHERIKAGAAAPVQATAPTTAPAPAGTPAAQQTPAEAAVEQAAADIWADADEFEFDDPDLEGVKFPIRVPKQFSQTAKRGYGRRQTYDRAVSFLNNANPVLRPLIESGRLNAILPLLQAALENPQYGDYVVSGFERFKRGESLQQAAQREAAAAQAPPQPQFDGAGNVIEDPFLAEQMRPVLDRLGQYEQRFSQFEQQQVADRQRQAQQQAENQRVVGEMRSAHQDIATMYPEHADLNRGADDPFWKKAVAYANQAGYVQRYGLVGGVVFGAQQVVALEQERLAATSSPAAAALAQVDARTQHLAAQSAAAARTVGGGAPIQPQPPAPPPPLSTIGANGKLKRPDEYLAEVVARMTNGSAVHA
jgi:hypothetical protein